MSESNAGATANTETPPPIHPGYYHVVITRAMERARKGIVVIDLRIVRGTIAGHEGKVHTEFLHTTDRAKPRLERLAKVLGLLSPGEGTQTLDFQEAVGAEFVVRLVEREYKGEPKVQVGYLSFWPLEHPDVPDSLRRNLADIWTDTPQVSRP